MTPQSPEHMDSVDFQKMMDVLSSSTAKAIGVENKIAQDIGDIKRFLQGPPEKPSEGLLWRVTQIETQLSFFKRWSLVVILVLVGGQPVVERVLPPTHSNDALIQAIYTLLQSSDADAVDGTATTPTPQRNAQ